jgi:hypothetical protein
VIEERLMRKDRITPRAARTVSNMGAFRPSPAGLPRGSMFFAHKLAGQALPLVPANADDGPIYWSAAMRALQFTER